MIYNFDNKEIALVGNATALLNKKYGIIIDSYETIVRFNRLPLEEYYINVGRRTDLFVWNYEGYKVSGNFVDEYVHNFNIDGYNYTERPSSGMVMIYHILHYTNYKSLTLYGFDSMESQSTSDPHFNQKRGPHSYIIEKSLIQSFMNEGKLFMRV